MTTMVEKVQTAIRDEDFTKLPKVLQTLFHYAPDDLSGYINTIKPLYTTEINGEIITPNDIFSLALVVHCVGVWANDLYSEKNDTANENRRMAIVKVKLLLGAGVDINYRIRKDGQTILTMVAGNGHDFLVEFFLQQGADANLTDANGMSPLFAAVMNQQHAIFRRLITAEVNYWNPRLARLDNDFTFREMGSLVNLDQVFGFTQNLGLFEVALWVGNRPVVRWCLSQNIETAYWHDGETHQLYATTYNPQHNLLTDGGEPLDLHITPVDLAAYTGDIRMLALLVQERPNWLLFERAARIAVMHNSWHVVEWLCAYKPIAEEPLNQFMRLPWNYNDLGRRDLIQYSEYSEYEELMDDIKDNFFTKYNTQLLQMLSGKPQLYRCLEVCNKDLLALAMTCKNILNILCLKTKLPLELYLLIIKKYVANPVLGAKADDFILSLHALQMGAFPVNKKKLRMARTLWRNPDRNYHRLQFCNKVLTVQDRRVDEVAEGEAAEQARPAMMLTVTP